jgi:muramoyltetrapeptide carboxypeptidase
MSKHIHILSPSGAINPTLIDGTIARLRAWGFNVSVGTHAREQWGRFAATDSQRIDNLLNALQDPTIDIILCARGG